MSVPVALKQVYVCTGDFDFQKELKDILQLDHGSWKVFAKVTGMGKGSKAGWGICDMIAQVISQLPCN